MMSTSLCHKILGVCSLPHSHAQNVVHCHTHTRMHSLPCDSFCVGARHCLCICCRREIDGVLSLTTARNLDLWLCILMANVLCAHVSATTSHHFRCMLPIFFSQPSCHTTCRLTTRSHNLDVGLANLWPLASQRRVSQCVQLYAKRMRV